jgi:predicted transglutaminase-like cysteine proteinase
MVCVVARGLASRLTVALSLLASSGSFVLASDRGSAGMEVIGFARAPAGFISFCAREPEDCRAPAKIQRAVLTKRTFAELDRINREVNRRIKPVTDMELYGREEHWAIPVDKGDCEDYVLLKRRLLIAAGWPSSALLITVVRDLADEGHAVLTVAADHGDYILDNQRTEILPWRQTGYEYIKRQSQTDPKAWVYVGSARSDARVSSTP